MRHRDVLLRAIGVVYVCAFTSIITSSTLILSPDVVHSTNTSPSLYVYIRAMMSHTMLFHAVGGVGIFLSFCVVIGFGTTFCVLLMLWLTYLAFVISANGVWLSTVSDYMMLEVGFLALFVAPLFTVAMYEPAPPRTLVLLVFRWLGIRVMMTTGWSWLVGDHHYQCVQHQLSCFDHFYETQMSPNPIAWYMHQLPRSIHQLQTLVALAVWLVVPCLMLLPHRKPRIIAAYVVIAYHATVMLTGSFNFLNLLLMIPPLAALDDECFGTRSGKRDSYGCHRLSAESQQQTEPLLPPPPPPVLPQRTSSIPDSLTYSASSSDDDAEHDDAEVQRVAIDDDGKSSVYISSIIDMLAASSSPVARRENGVFSIDRGGTALGVMFTEVEDDDDTHSLDSFALTPRRSPNTRPTPRGVDKQRSAISELIFASARSLHPWLAVQASFMASIFENRHRMARAISIALHTALCAFVVAMTVLHIPTIVHKPSTIITSPLYIFNSYGNVMPFHERAYRISLQHSDAVKSAWVDYRFECSKPCFQLPFHHMWLEHQPHSIGAAPQWLLSLVRRLLQDGDKHIPGMVHHASGRTPGWIRAKLSQVSFSKSRIEYEHHLVRDVYVSERDLLVSTTKRHHIHH